MDKKSIRRARIVQDVKVYELKRVSKEHGRKTFNALRKQGLIEGEETPTGRRFVDFDEAQVLADAL